VVLQQVYKKAAPHFCSAAAMSLMDRFFRTIAFPGYGFSSRGFSGYRIKVWFFGQVSIGFVTQRNNASGWQKIEDFVIVLS